MTNMSQRRRRDSNPRDAFDAYTISSRAPSTKLGDFSTIFSCAIREGQSRTNVSDYTTWAFQMQYPGIIKLCEVM